MIEKTSIVINRNKVESQLYNFIYVLTVIGLFLLNWDKTNEVNEKILIYIIRTITFLYIISFGILFSVKRSHFTTNGFFAWLFLLIVAVVVAIMGGRSVFEFAFLAVFLGLAFFITKSEMKINKKLLNISLFFIFVSFLIQMSIFSFDGRRVLSIGDPNYSSFAIFCVFLFCNKMGKKKISYLFLIMGFLTLSRNFMLAIVVFYIFENSPSLRLIFKKFGHTKILIVSIAVLLIFGKIFIATTSKYEVMDTPLQEREFLDMFTLRDASNYDRFLATSLFLRDLTSNPQKHLLSRDIEEYKEEVYRTIPHNSFFQLILLYGIIIGGLSILLLIYLFRINYHIYNISYLMSLLPYFLFLGGGLAGLYIVFLSFILSPPTVASQNK